MEAIGCGCPVLVGDVPGVDDLLGDARGAVCFDPTDTAGVANAIIGALQDPNALASRTAAIRGVAASRVDWEIIAGRYGELLSRSTRRELP
jgi:glycosyltransferase involved in cell wall biosynthesis